MTIVLPILLFAVCLGLFVPRMTTGVWLLLAAWILLIILYNFFKPTVVPLPPQYGIRSLKDRHDFPVGQA